MKFKLHSYLIKKYRRARVYKRFLQYELAYGNKNLAWTKRLSITLKGYNSDKLYLYDLKNYSLSDYCNDIEVNKVRAHNLVHGVLLDRKDIFHNQMARLQAGPKILGTFVSGIFYPHAGDPALDFETGVAQLPKGALIRAVGQESSESLVYDPDPHNGRVHLIDRESRKEPSRDALRAGSWKVLSPISGWDDGLTRITSARDRLGNVKICYAIQQLGRSSPVYCIVDTDSGILGEGVRIYREESRKENVKTFPDSDERLAGHTLSDWQSATKIVTDTHGALPNINAATWRLVSTTSGWQIIDATNRLDTVLYQCLAGPEKMMLN